MAPETPWLAFQNAVATFMEHLHHFPAGYEGDPVMYCTTDDCFKIALKRNEDFVTFCDKHAPGGAVDLSYANAYRGVLKMLEIMGCSFGNDPRCRGASEEAVVQRYKDFSEGKGVCPGVLQPCKAPDNLALSNPRAAFMIAHRRPMTEEEADALLSPEALAILQTPLSDE